MPSRFRVGVQFHPQHTSVGELRAAWTRADRMGAHSLWVWDHFFPLYGKDQPYLWPPVGDPGGSHFESWSLLAAMAADTVHAEVGVLISNVNFRNPDLLADMARTVDHISAGRVILGLGAGNIERDFHEYGFEFADTRARLESLERSIGRIKHRIAKLEPGPLGRLPMLIGGSGVKVTLRLVAQYADMWNSFGPPEEYAKQNQALDDWCRKLGRKPEAIERTVLLDTADEAQRLDDFLEAGVQHVIVGCAHPFDLGPIEALLDAASHR